MDDHKLPFPPSTRISDFPFDPAIPVLAFINVTPEAAKEASQAVNGLSSAIRDHGVSVGNGLNTLGTTVGSGLTNLGLGVGVGLSAIAIGLVILSRPSSAIRSLAALRSKQF